jgi:hypothetical protein
MPDCLFAVQQPLSWMPELRLVELSVHGWDLRSVLDPPGHLNPASLPVLLGPSSLPISFYLNRRWASRFGADNVPPDRLRVRFVWTDSPVELQELVIEGPGARPVPSVESPADVTMRCHPEVVVLLAMGRIDFPNAVDLHGMEVDGGAGPVDLLRRRFS